jgi:hypothetical protein
MSTTTRLNYDGRRFSPSGSPASVGRYHQDGDLVWAEFDGPTVRAGRLVGTCQPDGVIVASYCYLTPDGEPIAGSCVSTPTVLDDGRIKLAEQWRRLDGSVGVSEIEEVPGG